MTRLAAIAIVVASLLACSAESSLTDAADSGVPIDDTGEPDTGEPPALVDTWFYIDGAIDFTDGSPAIEDVRLVAKVLNQDRAETCSESLVITSFDAAEPPEDVPGMLTWWSVSSTPTCSGIPGAFELGVGDYDAQLAPPVSERAWNEETLNGMYLRYGARPVLIVGVAGVAEQYTGDQPRQTSAPLVEAPLVLSSLFLLSIESTQ